MLRCSLLLLLLLLFLLFFTAVAVAATTYEIRLEMLVQHPVFSISYTVMQGEKASADSTYDGVLIITLDGVVHSLDMEQQTGKMSIIRYHCENVKLEAAIYDAKGNLLSDNTNHIFYTIPYNLRYYTLLKLPLANPGLNAYQPALRLSSQIYFPPMRDSPAPGGSSSSSMVGRLEIDPSRCAAPAEGRNKEDDLSSPCVHNEEEPLDPHATAKWLWSERFANGISTTGLTEPEQRTMLKMNAFWRRNNGGFAPLPPGVYNAQASNVLYPHHEAFLPFKQWYGPIENGFIVDWLGIRTDIAFDCRNGSKVEGFDYAGIVPSYIMGCAMYEQQLAQIAKRSADVAAEQQQQQQQQELLDNTTTAETATTDETGLEDGTHAHPADDVVSAGGEVLPVAKGLFPMVDEEYFQWVDCLKSAAEAANRTTQRGQSRRYIVVELGARIGTWAVRGAAAFKQLVPDGEVTGVLVESWPKFCQWCHEHVRSNGLEADMTVVCSPATPSVVSSILDTLALVDLLDIDIQNGEYALLGIPGAEQQQLWTILNNKVRRIHLGTHSWHTHTSIVKMAETFGWIVDHSIINQDLYQECDATSVAGITWEPICLHNTTHGPVYLRDGILSLRNPRFF